MNSTIERAVRRLERNEDSRMCLRRTGMVHIAVPPMIRAVDYKMANLDPTSTIKVDYVIFHRYGDGTVTAEYNGETVTVTVT